MRSLLLTALLLLAQLALAGPITGVFQGTIVQLPSASTHAKTRWMYVQGKNGSIRRANIARAVIDYDEGYPQAKRRKRPADSLLMSSEVRVTAEQDEAKDGEWQATNVDIVSPPQADHHRRPKSGPTLARRQD